MASSGPGQQRGAAGTPIRPECDVALYGIPLTDGDEHRVEAMTRIPAEGVYVHLAGAGLCPVARLAG
jgi:hypothetical protein